MRRWYSMSLKDKAGNSADAAKDVVKETVDKVQDDTSREAEGRTERAIADLRQAGENLKDLIADLKK
jgi:uncharacterized protein YjbJ (UPF0337 family)